MQKKLISIIISTAFMSPFVLADLPAAGAATVAHAPPHAHVTHTAAQHPAAHAKVSKSIKTASTRKETTSTTAAAEKNKKANPTQPSKVAQPEQPKKVSATKTPSINQIFTLKNQTIKDHPNVMNGAAIQQLAKNPKITGQSAAILSALMLNVADRMQNPKNAGKYKNIGQVVYTKEQLTKLLADKNSDLSRGYENALEKINAVNKLPANQKLYGPQGLAKAHIIQQSIGDCFTLSTINGLLNTPEGVKHIQQMIIPTKDPNSFLVKLPPREIMQNGVLTKVAMPAIPVHLTDAEIGMYSKVVGGGQFVAVLSVAESEVLSNFAHLDSRIKNPDAPTTPFVTKTTPINIAVANGYGQQTLTWFTGTQYVTRHFDAKDASLNQNMANIVQKALKKHLPITIQTNIHDLSIIGYNDSDPKNPYYIINNPWGTSGPYTPWTGSPTYQMTNGVFKVPASAITNGFNSIVVPQENAKPLC